jgi:lipoyl(octanoyl) transferase
MKTKLRNEPRIANFVFSFARQPSADFVSGVTRIFEALDFLDDIEPHSAAMNMAIDEALLRCISAPMLRVYRWARPAVSFGYFEKWGPVQSAHPQRELVRRWTGGGVVLHGEDWTYSLLVPEACDFARVSAVESYGAIHDALTRALRDHGIDASVSENTHAKISQACFENAVRHDVLHDGKKIAGAAQRRTQFGLLHQGSIQNVTLGREFGREFALTLAARVQPQAPTIGDDARALAHSKYGAAHWLRKF